MLCTPCRSLKISVVIFILFNLSSGAYAQELSLDPSFSSFDGVVYSMPKMLLKVRGHLTKTILEKHSDKVYSYDTLTMISLNALDIPETYIKYGDFPGVTQKTKFCMLLDSEVKIPVDGYYEFKLHSDDGSILWVEDEMIVDNDGGHPMREKIETIALKEGRYPIKIWYFQGHPDRFGLKFDARYYGPIEDVSSIVNKMDKEIELPSDLLFEFKASTLSEAARISIAQIISDYDLSEVQTIEIVGHTDNIGLSDDNQSLSIKRARSVANYIKSLLPNLSSKLNVVGAGESSPKYSNETKEGRSKNRRVEIRFY